MKNDEADRERKAKARGKPDDSRAKPEGRRTIWHRAGTRSEGVSLGRQSKPLPVKAEDVQIVRRPAGTRSEGLAPGPRQAEALARRRAEQIKKGKGDD